MEEQYTLEEIKNIPKAELHVHLDGSLRPETLIELSTHLKEGRELFGAKELQVELQEVYVSKSLKAYLAVFQRTLKVLQSKDNLARVAKELVEDASEDGIELLEVRFCPALHTEEELSLEEVTETVISSLMQAGRKKHIRVGIIVCAIRQLGPEHSLNMAKLATRFIKQGVIGFDLAGDESASSAVEHSSAFSLAKKYNLSRTVHAGEAMGPESIKDALTACSAQRIGHGTSLIHDPKLLERIGLEHIVLEVCPSSNVHTGAVESLERHPASSYLKEGLLVTLNTDNRLVSQTTLSKELWETQVAFGWGKGQIDLVIQNGLDGSFLNGNG